MTFETFASADEATSAAADALLAALVPPGPKHLIVTGGRTPGPVYDRLAASDLDWSRVSFTLSDERFVDTSSKDSNEGLIRARLLTGHAAAATFVPLKGHGPTPDADARAANAAVEALIPFDAALVGMGDDGHVASIFPTTPGFAALLSPDTPRAVVGIDVAGLQPFVPRISLTGRAILGSKLIVVLVSGDGKRALLDRVQSDTAFAPPISHLIRQQATPVRILWWPGA